MYELKTNTAYRIPVGPLVDPTDFKTAETGLTVTGLSVQIYQIKNDGTAVVRSQFTPTASGGDNDMALVSSSTDGMYDLELTAAQLNFLGNARITFYDVDGFIVHWIDIKVVSAAYFDWKYGTTIPEALATVKAVTDKLDTAMEADGAVYRFTENALEQAPTGGGTAPTVEQIRQEIDSNSAQLAAILEDTGTTIPALIAASPSGGAIPFAYTLTDSADASPIDGAEVWVTTDAAGVNVIASGVTDAYGVVNFMLDAGDYYFWRKRSGYNFVNPDLETVS